MFSQHPAPTSIRRNDIEECHYICHLDNLHNILTNGILSHRRAHKLSDAPTDISDGSVQDRRSQVRVPRRDEEKGRLALHRHAVLYLNAHNAMMHVRKNQHTDLCVLRIYREILDRGDAMLSSRNASTSVANFFPPTRDPLYSPTSSRYLSVPRIEGYDNEGKQIRQAEVMLPYKIEPSYIGGIFVSNQGTQDHVQAILNELENTLPITQHPSLFFQGVTRFVSLASFQPLAPLTIEQQAALVTDFPDSDSSKTNSDVEDNSDDENRHDRMSLV